MNELTFFYSNGRGGETFEVLKNRVYTNGTMYMYYGADTFLYLLSCFLSVSTYARRMDKVFVQGVAERFGSG